MGVLDQVIQMREQGFPDQDIVSQLQEQGINPRTINDALNQANIKNAVGGMDEIPQGMQYNAEDVPIPQGQERYQPQGQYSPSSQEYADDVYMPQAQSTPTPGRSEEYTYQEQPYSGGSGYAGGTDADTMIEIAQQVFSEKIKKIQVQLEDLNEFRTIYQTRVDGIYERLKKVESTMDRLQSAILEKVGSYGQGIESVKKELSMMQDTYGKIVDAISEKHHAHQEHTTHQTHVPEHHHTPEHHHVEQSKPEPVSKPAIVHHHTKPTRSAKQVSKKRSKKK